MSFLYPGFLFALSALSIPIIIHLFNFRRTRKVFFSNTRFLKQVKEATSAKQKLKHLLILASRLLFLLFLVLTFAQPIIPAQEQFASGKEIVIYIDNSLSMSGRTDEGMSALDEGVEFAHQIVDMFPADTRYLFITNDFAPYSNNLKSRTETQDLLTQVGLSAVSRSMKEVHERIAQHLTGDAEFFWISDFQQSTIGEVSVSSFDSLERVHLVPVAFDESPNIFVDTAFLENPFVVGGERNRLLVRLRNSGTNPVDQQLVKLLVNDLQSGTTTVTIPANGVVETTFDIPSSLTGFNEVVVNFNDVPISFDNSFYLALNFSEKISVVEIKNATAPTVVEKVFGNSQVFSTKSYEAGNVNFTLMQQADLVVVNGLDRPGTALLQALNSYLDNFGTLLIIPGDNPDPVAYRQLPGLPPVHAADAPMMELEHPDFRNPFFENVFEDQSDRLAMPSAKRIMNWGADPSALLKFRDGSPFLSLFSGNGKLFVMASPLNVESTSLFNNALFVPVMYRIAASGKKNEFRPYYTLSDPVVSVKLDSVLTDIPLRLVGREEIIPQQRKVGDRVNFELPRFSIDQGFYRVVYDKDTVATVALNLDKKESFMTQYDGDEMKRLLGDGPNIHIFKADSPGAFSSEIKARYLGTPLWKYALALAIFFLALEILLIRFLK